MVMKKERDARTFSVFLCEVVCVLLLLLFFIIDRLID